MSNYPNMSYCAFENTLLAMQQLINMLEDATDNEKPIDMSQYELEAFNRMDRRLEKLAIAMGHYRTMLERISENTEG